MIKRVQGTGKRPRLPRKGSIRFVLGFIVLVFIVRSVCHHKTAPVDTGKKAAVVQKKPSGGGLSCTGPAHAHLLSRQLSFTDVCALMQDRTPDLKRMIDTVKVNGKPSLVFYSIDPDLQVFVGDLMEKYHPKYGAVVALEPGSGRVRCLVSYTNPEGPDRGDNLYCKAWFPAASIFKIVTAAGAIEKGHFSAESKIRVIGANHTLYKSQLAEDPKNFREVPLEEAYALSINPAFARIGLYVLGAQGLKEYIGKFGFNAVVPFEMANEAPYAAVIDTPFALAELASGFNKQTRISPLFGALIASAIAEKGKSPVPYMVDSITDAATHTLLYRAKPALLRTPMGETAANELKYMMSKVAQYGTAKKSYVYMRKSYKYETVEFGGKTGTIDKDSVGRIDWFVGFARHRTKPDQRIAVGIVTVHGAFWNVRSSYIAAEISRKYIKQMQQFSDEQRLEEARLSALEKDGPLLVQ